MDNVSRYKNRTLLGRGEACEVYRAQDSQTGQWVAIKCIRAECLAQKPELSRLIVNESGVYRQVKHPRIPCFVGAGEPLDNATFLVLEYLDGYTLEKLFQRGPVETHELLEWSEQLLDALIALNKKGWVHRDVKPSNVVLLRNRQPKTIKLIDFGLSCLIGPQVEEQAQGTLEYMSPEQLLLQPVDSRSDLWSVGALLYRGLSGRPPWPCSTLSERVRSLSLDGAPRLRRMRPDLPENICDFVDRCLLRKPTQRWSSSVEAVQVLRQCRVTL